MMEEKRLYEILVPIESNDGNEFPIDHHYQWDEYVQGIAGGLTILRTSKGQWVNPDDQKLFAERMIPVRVLCSKSEIETIIDFTIDHYDQKAVLAYVISDEVILKHRGD